MSISFYRNYVMNGCGNFLMLRASYMRADCLGLMYYLIVFSDFRRRVVTHIASRVALGWMLFDERV